MIKVVTPEGDDAWHNVKLAVEKNGDLVVTQEGVIIYSYGTGRWESIEYKGDTE